MAQAATGQGPLSAPTLLSPTPLPTASSQSPQRATSSHGASLRKASISAFEAGAAQSVVGSGAAGFSAVEAAPSGPGGVIDSALSSTAGIAPAAESGSTDSSSRDPTEDGRMASSLASTGILDSGQSTYVGGMAEPAVDHSSSSTPAVIFGGSQILSAVDDATIGSTKVSVNGQGLGVIAPASTKPVETANAVGVLSAAAVTFPTGNVDLVIQQQSPLSFSYDPAGSAITVTAGSTVLTASQLSGASGTVEIEGMTVFVDGSVITLYGG